MPSTPRAQATRSTALSWRGCWRETIRRLPAVMPMSRRRSRPAAMAPWHQSRARQTCWPSSSADKALCEGAQEAPEDGDLLAEPATAIVGIDAGILDAGRPLASVVVGGAAQNVPDRQDRTEIVIVDITIGAARPRMMQPMEARPDQELAADPPEAHIDIGVAPALDQAPDHQDQDVILGLHADEL